MLVRAGWRRQCAMGATHVGAKSALWPRKDDGGAFSAPARIDAEGHGGGAVSAPALPRHGRPTGA
eukprot:9426515-Lingulodinium_polyedra.AAC.1